MHTYMNIVFACIQREMYKHTQLKQRSGERKKAGTEVSPDIGGSCSLAIAEIDHVAFVFKHWYEL